MPVHNISGVKYISTSLDLTSYSFGFALSQYTRLVIELSYLQKSM